MTTIDLLNPTNVSTRAPQVALRGFEVVATAAHVGVCEAMPCDAARASADPRNGSGSKRIANHTYRTLWTVRPLGRSGAPPGESPWSKPHHRP